MYKSKTLPGRKERERVSSIPHGGRSSILEQTDMKLSAVTESSFSGWVVFVFCEMLDSDQLFSIQFKLVTPHLQANPKCETRPQSACCADMRRCSSKTLEKFYVGNSVFCIFREPHKHQATKLRVTRKPFPLQHKQFRFIVAITAKLVIVM